jgi:hypothetical protein
MAIAAVPHYMTPSPKRGLKMKPSSIFDKPSPPLHRPMPDNTPPDVLETVRLFALKHGYWWKMKMHHGWRTGNFDFDGSPRQMEILRSARHRDNAWVIDLPATLGGDPEKVH